MTKTPVELRFWSKVNKASDQECWIWIAHIGADGYGVIRDGELKKAHRVSYKLHYGTIDDNLLCLHKCDNRKCVNPHHLYLGDHKDNANDCVNRDRHYQAKQTECYVGHPYTSENTITNKRTLARSCRACSKIYKQAWRRARKEKQNVI